MFSFIKENQTALAEETKPDPNSKVGSNHCTTFHNKSQGLIRRLGDGMLFGSGRAGTLKYKIKIHLDLNQN